MYQLQVPAKVCYRPFWLEDGATAGSLLQYFISFPLFLFFGFLWRIRWCMDIPPVPVQPVQPLTARLRWKQAVRRITQILRLRKHWAALGRHLQLPRIQSLVSGLERRGGRLIRRRAASR